MTTVFGVSTSANAALMGTALGGDARRDLSLSVGIVLFGGNVGLDDGLRPLWAEFDVDIASTSLSLSSASRILAVDRGRADLRRTPVAVASGRLSTPRTSSTAAPSGLRIFLMSVTAIIIDSTHFLKLGSL